MEQERKPFLLENNPALQLAVDHLIAVLLSLPMDKELLQYILKQSNVDQYLDSKETEK